jgi:hypothetical protein
MAVTRTDKNSFHVVGLDKKGAIIVGQRSGPAHHFELIYYEGGARTERSNLVSGSFDRRLDLGTVSLGQRTETPAQSNM